MYHSNKYRSDLRTKTNNNNNASEQQSVDSENTSLFKSLPTNIYYYTKNSHTPFLANSPLRTEQEHFHQKILSIILNHITLPAKIQSILIYHNSTVVNLSFDSFFYYSRIEEIYPFQNYISIILIREKTILTNQFTKIPPFSIAKIIIYPP